MTIRFEFSIAADHPALPGHFPGRAIVPGVLLLDHVLSGTAARFGRPVRTLQRVKFSSALLPCETATVEIEGEGTPLKFSVRTLRAGLPVVLASGSLRLAADLR